MVMRRGYITRFVAVMACLLATVSVSGAADVDGADSQSLAADLSPVVEEQAGEDVFETIEAPEQGADIEAYRHREASAGYRFVGIGDNGGRAAEYDYLHSSFAGNARLVHLGKDLKLDVDGAFLNRKDYLANLMFDYAGYYRLTARTESLFHNLDHLTMPDVDIFHDDNPADRYGITTRQDTVQFRYKLRDYPIHLNLSHWLIDRQGTQQLRYADFDFTDYYSDTKYSRVYSSTRNIHRLSHEGTAGFDAHLGAINVVYSFLFRQFDDRRSTLIDKFNDFSVPGTTKPAEHNGDPENRYFSHTVKLYTSPAGGVTGAASYSYGRRDNRSSLATVAGADKARDIIQNAAGDFTYSPCAWFTAALKYRHLEIDRDTPATLRASYLTPSSVELRHGIDTRRDIISANFTLRPTTMLSLNGEYQGIFNHRDNTGTGPGTMWDLPENSDTHKGNLTVLFRPFKGLRLRGLYEYTTTSHPLYDSDPERKHEGRLLATYTNSSRWGATANYRIAREWNDHVTRETHVDPASFPGQEDTTYVLPRKRNFVHAALGFWVSPVERLTVSGNVGFLRTKAEQAVLFARVFNGQDAASEYVSQGEIYSVNAAYRASEKVDLSCVYQQVRSRSEFTPEATTGDGVTSTAGIRELSRVKTLEHSLSSRIDYRLTKYVGCALDYTYRAYDNRLSSDGEGDVHVVTAQLKAAW